MTLFCDCLFCSFGTLLFCSSGKSGGVKENDVDDYLANDVHYVGSHYTGTTLPLKASNKEPSKCYIKVKQHLLFNNIR